MKISDFMEVVVVDKNGMHKMETIKDIKEYLGDDKMNLETKINHPYKNVTGDDMNDIPQIAHDELIFIRAIEQNWDKICEELPVVVLPKCVDDEFIKDLYDIFIGTYCPKRFEMSYNRIQEAINMMFLIDAKH